MKKILILMTILSLVLTMKKVDSKETIIPKEAIRLRVIANSDNPYDQKIKTEVSILIEQKVQDLLKESSNINEARIILKNNINNLNLYIEEYLHKNNYNYDYKISYGDALFPQKKYKGITYEQGEYETLLITIGKGKGKNWWCVLFPPLCLLEAEETEKDDVEYKFFVQELINKYF